MRGHINEKGEFVQGEKRAPANVFIKLTRFIIVKENSDSSVNQRATIIAALIAFFGIVTGISMMINEQVGVGIVAIVLSLLVAVVYEYISKRKGLLTFLIFASFGYIGFSTVGNIGAAAIYGGAGWVLGMILEKINNIKYRK